MPSLRASLGKKSLEDLLEEAGGVAVGSDGSSYKGSQGAPKDFEGELSRDLQFGRTAHEGGSGEPDRGPGSSSKLRDFSGLGGTQIEDTCHTHELPPGLDFGGSSTHLESGRYPRSQGHVGVGVGELGSASDRSRSVARCSRVQPGAVGTSHIMLPAPSATHPRGGSTLEASRSSVDRGFLSEGERPRRLRGAEVGKESGPICLGGSATASDPEPESERERGNSCPQATTQKEGRKGREQGNRSREGKQLKERACEL